MLHRCPECGYDLQGLPASHRCPECGLAYDADSVLAWIPLPRMIWLGVAGYLLGGLGLLQGLIRGLPNDLSGLIYKLAWGLFYFVIGHRIFLLVLHRHRGSRAAVLPDYLFLSQAGSSSQRIPWSEITRAAANPGTKSVAIFLRETRTVRDISDVFRTRDECEAFAACINRRVPLSLTQGSPHPNQSQPASKPTTSHTPH